MPKPIFLLNGPNLNLLGLRQPEVYGRTTLAEVEADCAALAEDLGLHVRAHQSNHEGQIIDWIHEARGTRLGHHHQPRRVHPHLRRHSGCAERLRRPGAGGAHHEHPQARGVPPPFLCLAARRWRDRGLRHRGLPVGAAPHGHAARGQLMDLPVNRFKQALREGRQQIGLWNSIPGPVVAEAIATAGFDWIVDRHRTLPHRRARHHRLDAGDGPLPGHARRPRRLERPRAHQATTSTSARRRC